MCLVMLYTYLLIIQRIKRNFNITSVLVFSSYNIPQLRVGDGSSSSHFHFSWAHFHKVVSPQFRSFLIGQTGHSKCEHVSRSIKCGSISKDDLQKLAFNFQYFQRPRKATQGEFSASIEKILTIPNAGMTSPSC